MSTPGPLAGFHHLTIASHPAANLGFSKRAVAAGMDGTGPGSYRGCASADLAGRGLGMALFEFLFRLGDG
jgi:hypothetical protein